MQRQPLDHPRQYHQVQMMKMLGKDDVTQRLDYCFRHTSINACTVPPHVLPSLSGELEYIHNVLSDTKKRKGNDLMSGGRRYAIMW